MVSALKPNTAGARNPFMTSDTSDRVAAFLLGKREKMSIRALENESGINRGMISAIIAGRRRPSNKIIDALNDKYGTRFRHNMAVVPCCPACGVPHVRKTCPAKKSESRPREPRLTVKIADLEATLKASAVMGAKFVMGAKI